MEDQGVVPNAATGLAKAADESLSLSLSQHEVWLDQMAWPDSAHLNIGGGAFLHGPLDLGVFKAALQILVQENQALRLVPDYSGRQTLLANFEPDLEVIDFHASAMPEDDMRAWWSARIRQPIFLGLKPPWRFSLLRANGELHGLTIQFHHLVMDGWGTTLVMQRWSQIYRELVAGTYAPALQNADYRDYIDESSRYLKSGVFDTDRDFWRSALPALPPQLLEQRFVVADRMALPQAHLCIKKIARTDFNAVTGSAVIGGWTVFNLFLAALAIYFARTTGQNEIAVGVPSLNRGGRKYRGTLGMFVGVMVVPVVLPAVGSAADLLTQIGAFMRSALRRPRFPLSELAKEFNLGRHGRSSLFDLLLSFERQDYELSFGSAQLRASRQLFAGKARYPLSVTVCEFHADEEVEIVVEASAAAFSEAEAAFLPDRIWHLVTQIAREPDLEIRKISIVPEAEFRQIRHLGAGPVQAEPVPASWIEHFDACARQNPLATAMVWDGGQLSYGGLLASAKHIAAALTQRGIVPGQLVAFAIDRSPELVMAMLGISLAGAAFLPLDPDAPINRNRDVLDEARVAALLLTKQQWARLNGLHVQAFAVEELIGSKAAATDSTARFPGPFDLAYVLFTSGSTGKPKGVAVEQGALTRRLGWLAQCWRISAADRSIQSTQITFDPSLIEVCMPLMYGASIALPAPGKLLPESLPAFAARFGGNFLAFVPSTLARFLQGVPAADGLRLKVACCGGEILSPELASNFLRATGARLFNLYGPTEAVIFATALECEVDPGTPVGPTSLSVGRPVADTCIEILDGNLLPLPLGANGEIYIGGSSLARCYLHRPDLTDDAFIETGDAPLARLYRTGDRGALSPDGQLQFSGRLDRQVKLRGYRIEPAEIELALTAQEGVSQAAVQLVEHGGKTSLHAWVVAEPNVSLDQVRVLLTRQLPIYMVPSTFQRLDMMPQSATGKIDYSALPLPKEKLPVTSIREAADGMEFNLLALWRDVLKNPTLSVEDNFFEAGGDSLAAISVLAGIEKLMGRRVPMYLLSERPTVGGLAAALGEGTASTGLMLNLSNDEPANGDMAPSMPSRAVVYLAASGHGDLLRFQNLARELADSCEIRMLQPPSASTIARTVDLAALYADIVSSQSSGPCYLAGFSVGGLAALETARLVSLRGKPVHALFLVDTIFPSRLWGGTVLWRALRWVVARLHIQDLSMNGRRLGAMLNDPGLFGQVMAVSGYRVNAFHGTTHLVKSIGLASRWDRLLFSGWRLHMGKQLTEHRVKGMHGSMFEPQNVGDLANVIKVATSPATRS